MSRFSALIRGSSPISCQANDSEPGGAAAFASLLSGAYHPQAGERVAVVICGGNTTAVDFSR